jgi:hypothetical protein
VRAAQSLLREHAGQRQRAPPQLSEPPPQPQPLRSVQPRQAQPPQPQPQPQLAAQPGGTAAATPEPKGAAPGRAAARERLAGRKAERQEAAQQTVRGGRAVSFPHFIFVYINANRQHGPL